MSEQENIISAKGKAEAEAELKHLTEVRRPEIVAAIKSAREFGDLSENAEYHAAREEQGLNEAKIRNLEHHLAHAEVGEDVTADGQIGVGSTVSFKDLESGDVKEITLVHRLEADAATSKVSVESPVAGALLGASQGDQVGFETPRGDSKQLEILSVS